MDEEGSPGILSVTVDEVKLTRDTEMVGAMSPYCTLTHKKKKLKTKVRSNAGKHAKFGDTFTFDLENSGEEIFVRVWDQDLMSSDAVGFVKVKVSSLMINGGTTDSFTLYYENNSAGTITLTSVWAPEGGSEYDNLKAEFEEQTARLEAELEEAKAKAEEMEARQEEINAKLEEQAAELAAKEEELQALKESGNQEGAQQFQQQMQQQQMEQNRLKAELAAAQQAQQSLLNPNGAGYASTGYQHQVGMIPMQQMMPQFQNMGMQMPGMMMGGMQQPMMGGYPGMQPPMGGMGMQQPMMGGGMYGQPMGGMGQPMMQPQMGMGGMPMQQPGMYGQPMMGGMPQQQMMGGYPQQQQMMGGYGGQPQMGYQQQQPMMQQQHKPQTYCANNHVMQWKNDNPYPGSVAVSCDVCSRDIAVAYWFHHCPSCQSDYCQQCGKQRTR